MESEEILKTVKELQTAKDNVRYLLDHADASVNMKGLTYWANRVEELRTLIKKDL